MSLDIELILQALSKGFEELEAKWETRFSSGGVIHHGQEAASELPFPSPATTSYPAVADVAAAPTVPPEGADAAQEIPLASCVLSPAKDFAHGGSVDTECIDNFSLLPDVLLGDIVSRLPVKDAVRTAVFSRRWKPIWRVVPLVLVDTHICLAGEDKIPKHFVRSHSDDIAPAAPSAENVPTNYSHTRCLKVCLSHNITVPKPISVALTSISAHATSSASVDSYLNNFKQSSKAPDDPFAIYDRSVQVHRYITNYNLAYSIGVVSCRITLVHYGHVFEELSDQIAKILLQLLASLIDMAPWPPPGELEAVCDNAEVRPSPWPSFNLAEGVNVGWCCSLLGQTRRLPPTSNSMVQREFQWLLHWNYGAARFFDGVTNYAAMSLCQIFMFLLQMHGDGVLACKSAVPVDDIHIRPTPWPSFNILAIVIQWPIVLSKMFCWSISQSMMKIHFDNISGYCLRQWLGFLENAMQAYGFITELAVYMFKLPQGAILFAVDTSKGVLGNCQYLAACITFLWHLISTKRTIMLSFVKNQWSILLPGYRSVVVFQLTVLRHAGFGKVLMDMVVKGSEIYQVTRGILFTKLIDLYKVLTWLNIGDVGNICLHPVSEAFQWSI